MYNINIKWYNYTVIPNIQLSTKCDVSIIQLYTIQLYNYATIQLCNYTFYQLYTLYWLFHKLYTILYSIAGIIASKYL